MCRLFVRDLGFCFDSMVFFLRNLANPRASRRTRSFIRLTLPESNLLLYHNWTLQTCLHYRPPITSPYPLSSILLAHKHPSTYLAATTPTPPVTLPSSPSSNTYHPCPCPSHTQKDLTIVPQPVKKDSSKNARSAALINNAMGRKRYCTRLQSTRTDPLAIC